MPRLDVMGREWGRWLRPGRANLGLQPFAGWGWFLRRSPQLVVAPLLVLLSAGSAWLIWPHLAPPPPIPGQEWVQEVAGFEVTGRGLAGWFSAGTRGTIIDSKRESGAPIKLPVVPYMSQWVPEEQSGRNNCLPASVAMVIASYGRKVSVHEAALVIRDGRDGAGNGLLDFDESTWEDLLRRFDLAQEEVNDMASLSEQLKKGRPVIMLVDNRQYMRTENGRQVPYPPGRGFEGPHFVVVTNYDTDAEGAIRKLYINDPLAVKQEGKKLVEDAEAGTSFPVPIDTFARAVTRAKPSWHGLAVFPRSG